jgi:hypothetical protein
MRDFMKQAYDSDKGYAIKKNPTTGLDEMFVAGTHSPTTKRGITEWFQNIGEGAEHLVGMDKQKFNLFLKHREEFAYKLEEEARTNNVKVVYGHSRGAAIMSDFEDRDYIFIGLDGATGIAQNHSDIINIEHKGDVFDFAIAAHDKTARNIHVPGKFHNVSEKKKKSKKVVDPASKRVFKKKKGKKGNQKTYFKARDVKSKHKKQTKTKASKKKKGGEIVSPPQIQKKRGFYENPVESISSKRKKKRGGRGKKRKIESPPEIFRTHKFLK